MGSPGRIFQVSGTLVANKRLVQVEMSCYGVSEFCPAYTSLVGEVPDTFFFIYQNIKRGIYQVGNIGRRNKNIIRYIYRLILLQVFTYIVHKIVFIPWAEKSTGTNGE